MAYEVKLNAFEGSLDLLLFLIKKNKINIYDIPIAEITEQYLSYVQEWHVTDMEIASDFIVMASRLLEIKSQMLLPRNRIDEEDPRKELVSQLLEYQTVKAISVYLSTLIENEENVYYKDPDELCQSEEETNAIISINADKLYQYIKRLLATYQADHTYRSENKRIVRDNYTIADRIGLIRKCLTDKEYDCFISLIKDRDSVEEIIVTFQAILEMYKTGEIDIEQDDLFNDIMIYRGGK